MADLQVTQEVIVCLHSFHNVDLFQRGYYQVRCHIEDVSKGISFVECDIKEVERKAGNGRSTPCLFKPLIDKNSATAISKTIEVYYKHEEVLIEDLFTFQVHALLDSSKLDSQIPLKLQLVVDLYFSESTRRYPATPRSLEHASTQNLVLHMSTGEPFHAYRPVLFDYFHFAAVTLTVHSSLVAFRQPWSSALKSLHPIWSGKSGHVRQYTYTCLFGKNSSGIQPTHQLERRHKEHASYMHRKLCLQLLRLYENLLEHYHSLLSLLPEYGQMKLSSVDVDAKLEVLNCELNNLDTAEDVYLRMGDDLYLLSTELNMLWTQFSEQFVFENVLLQQLIHEHHSDRMEHMKEAIFTQELPWEALCSSLEIGTSQQARMFNSIKNSMYYQLVVPINLECAALDGDSATMPIIFEDKYVPGKTMDGDFPENNRKLSLENEYEIDFTSSNQHRPSNNANIRTDARQQPARANPNCLPVRETNLPGPERTSSSHLCTDSATAHVNDIDFKFKDAELSLCPTENLCSSSVFYTDLESDPGGGCQDVADDVLLIEDLNVGDDEEVVTKSKQMLAVTKSSNDQPYSSFEGRGGIEDSPSPARPHKPKLWSCFPTKSNSPYKGPSSLNLSQPYLPLERQLSLRKVNDDREEQTRRFQDAKDTLEINSDIPGHSYRLKTDPIYVKPYFTERMLATTDNIHLVVCVHGLDGNSGDLRLVRCYLEMALPLTNLDFLMSEINQEDTFCDIDELTTRLVKEILDYIEEQNLEVARLSFVGHSLGNIIIRNAVVHSNLYLYRNKLYTFLSLSGPHLGMQFHTSNLVSTGMWLMQKWKKEGSLVQLALNDTPDPRQSFMYRLSLTNGFQYFKNVLLVSSVQDHYVPFHSARVEMSKSVVKDNSDVGRVYKEMLDHILGPLMAQEEVNIVKYSVHHPMPSSANTFIGRAAHIAMLDSEIFLEKFILCVGHQYFE